jgi:hypothetical protein
LTSKPAELTELNEDTVEELDDAPVVSRTRVRPMDSDSDSDHKEKSKPTKKRTIRSKNNSESDASKKTRNSKTKKSTRNSEQDDEEDTIAPPTNKKLRLYALPEPYKRQPTMGKDGIVTSTYKCIMTRQCWTISRRFYVGADGQTHDYLCKLICIVPSKVFGYGRCPECIEEFGVD